MRYTANAEISLSSAFLATLVVLRLRPPLFFDVLFNIGCRIINRKSNYSYFLTPFLAFLFKHFLIVGHRFLARSTPSGPKIKQQNCTFLMSDCGKAFLHAFAELNNGFKLITYSIRISNFDRNINFFKYLLNFRLNLIGKFFFIPRSICV